MLKGLSEIFKTYVELIKIFLCSVPLFVSSGSITTT